jgi:hypothetical protein
MPDQTAVEPYLFYGVIRPERATISFQYPLAQQYSLFLKDKKVDVKLKISVILNQLAATVESDIEWDVFDLRNMIASIIHHDLAILSFSTGYGYVFELTRVINRSLGVDQVFGIEIPAIENRQKAEPAGVRFSEIKPKTYGINGVYLNRCFSDLASAMKYHDDAPFYCYRAIESLRNHCAAQNGVLDSGDGAQWQKFREVSGRRREEIERYKKEYVDQQRHGKPGNPMSDQERAEMFLLTWDIVDAYLDSI